MPHPDEEQLLRYADGELPARRAAGIRSHLNACWHCRAALDELQCVVGECVRYRAAVLQRHLPAPPAPWVDIYREFDVIDASFDHPSLAGRLAAMLRWPMHHAPKWVPAAVALMLVWALLYRYRQTPSVQASELLRKAVVAAQARPARPHHLRLQTRDHRLVRWTGAQPAAADAGDRQTLDSLKTLFVAANYNWDDPLSARAYQAWRNQLPAKRDQVTRQQDGYGIRTDSDSGELKEATLTLRSQDLQPTEGRFEFRNQEWVEITDLSDETEPPANPISASGLPVPDTSAAAPTLAPETGVAPAPALPATAGDELRVWTALHQVGADLGDPVEVSRSGGEILVTGVGLAPERRQEIQDALRSQSGVVVRFSDSAPPGAQPERAAPEIAPNPDVRQLQARIAEQIGGRANFEQLASQVLDMSEPVMSRVYALRRLEERFPVAVEAQLSPADLRALRQLQQEHIASLAQQIAELQSALRPALASVSGPPAPAPDSRLSSAAWQPATEELFLSARRVEKSLAVVFGAATAEPGAQLPSELLSNLAQFRAKVEAYRHLLTASER